LPKDQKRRALEQMKGGWPPYSYNPMRASQLDIMNIAAGPLVDLPRTPWLAIAADITRRCNGDLEAIAANLQAGEGLYNFTTEFEIVGRRHAFYSLAVGLAQKVTYWSPVVLAVEKGPVVPFIDPRRTKKLTLDARRFVFSMMNEHIRVPDPDFAEVRFAILQFANSHSGPRAAISHFDDGIKLWSFAELDEMVRETYELWYEVLDGRTAEARRSAVKGSLL
jgi:hypothetical protein